ncbi:MAG: hypothetical protein GWP10_03835 [Nitrospiraceae bacterium]|nr:hypothetical protein [Nitrospiraceae bacterium]
MGPRSATLRMSQRRLYDSSSKKALFSRALSIVKQETIVSIFVLGLLILGLWTSYETHNISGDIASMHVEESRLMAQRQDLKSQEVRLKSVTRMQELGRKLGLHPPTDSQIVYLK